jgi:hypothetical protein
VFRRHAIIQESARRVAEAANGTLQGLRDGRIAHEPEFTNRMLGRIELAMEGYQVKNVQWTAMTLTSLVPNSQEHRYGADFLGVFNADLPDYKATKGFLAQAKRIEPSDRISASDCQRMKEQCLRMLAISPTASYLFLYARAAISVVPARAVVHAVGTFNPHELYGRSITTFFEEHFECFFGDPVLDAAHVDALKNAEQKQHILVGLTDQFLAERLLYLGIAPIGQQPTLDLWKGEDNYGR